MDNDPIPYVKPCNSLLIQIKKDKITSILITKLRTISNLDLLKDSLELLKFACLITENLLYGKKYKEKLLVKDIVFAAFEKVFGNFNRENVSNQIIFLYENQQIIPSPNSTKLYAFIKKWFSNKKKKY